MDFSFLTLAIKAGMPHSSTYRNFPLVIRWEVGIKYNTFTFKYYNLPYSSEENWIATVSFPISRSHLYEETD